MSDRLKSIGAVVRRSVGDYPTTSAGLRQIHIQKPPPRPVALAETLRRISFIFLVLVAAGAFGGQTAASAHDTTCQRLSMGQGELICPPPFGGLLADINGSTVCGPGFCARDSYGKVKCSSQPGGAADLDSNGNVVCVGGCIDGATSYCVAPRP